MRLRQAHAILEAVTALEAAGLGFELHPMHYDFPGNLGGRTRDSMSGYTEIIDPGVRMTDLPAELMDRLHAEALAEDAARGPYCTGDRCEECTPNDECCEATCGCCPRVSAQGWCWLGSEREDGSRYCSQHGEGWLNDRTPEAERRYELLRDA